MAAECAKSKFRLGLLLDDLFVSKYIVEFVNRSQSHDQLEISHVFLASQSVATTSQLQHSPPSLKGLRRSRIAGLIFKIIVAIERLFLIKNGRHHDHLRKLDISDLLPNVAVHQLHECHSVALEGPVVDLLITFSTLTPLNSVSRIAKQGIFAISHSDEYIDPFGPAGFWEVYFRCDTTEFTIHHLNDTCSESQVCLRGRVGTEFYYLLNQATLFEKSIYYLFRAVERFATSGGRIRFKPKFPVCRIRANFPTGLQAIIYFAGLIGLATGKILRKVRGYNFLWNVAFVHSDWRNAVLSRATVIENPPRHYLADPFLIQRNGGNFCFVEDYDNVAQRGKIAVYELGPQGAARLGVAIEESFHLSYPYLFQYRNSLYMCPESSANRDVRIYKCLTFPLRWQLERIIMRDVSAVDTMLLEKDGRWWMLTNTDPAHWDDFSLELSLFYANSPLDEQWTPHPENPFFIDASRTRNAGVIKEGDRLFRVAQGKGFDMYGKRTSVNEIMELTDQSFVERRVCVISPTFKRGIVGTHHLHSNGQITIVDLAHDGGACQP